MRARRSLPGLALLTLFAFACGSGPPSTIADGNRIRHEAGAFSVVVPDGWQAHRSRDGLSLVREVPYEGGYPTLNLRRLAEAEVEHYSIDGRQLKLPPGDVEFSYERWRNSRGRGYRLDALVRTSGAGVFAVDASVWDSASRMDVEFFDATFWPIVNSLQE